MPSAPTPLHPQPYRKGLPENKEMRGGQPRRQRLSAHCHRLAEKAAHASGPEKLFPIFH